jgi:hypothetical protein
VSPDCEFHYRDGKTKREKMERVPENQPPGLKEITAFRPLLWHTTSIVPKQKVKPCTNTAKIKYCSGAGICGAAAVENARCIVNPPM